MLASKLLALHIQSHLCHPDTLEHHHKVRHKLWCCIPWCTRTVDIQSLQLLEMFLCTEQSLHPLLRSNRSHHHKAQDCHRIFENHLAFYHESLFLSNHTWNGMYIVDTISAIKQIRTVLTCILLSNHGKSWHIDDVVHRLHFQFHGKQNDMSCNTFVSTWFDST